MSERNFAITADERANLANLVDSLYFATPSHLQAMADLCKSRYFTHMTFDPERSEIYNELHRAIEMSITKLMSMHNRRAKWAEHDRRARRLSDDEL